MSRFRLAAFSGGTGAVNGRRALAPSMSSVRLLGRVSHWRLGGGQLILLVSVESHSSAVRAQSSTQSARAGVNCFACQMVRADTRLVR